MKVSWKKIWSRVGISGLVIAVLFGNLIYMNLRPADPILPGWEDYDPSRFADLMRRGEPVLVEIYAPWCPTCLLQHRALETLHKEDRAPRIRAVRVDFEGDEDFVKAKGFTSTGTLVIFRNGREEIRATGLVTPDKIENFLTSYLANRIKR
ncbi:MAG: thioredoxin family protein [Alphaproteobacteria bacterium]|nr:thioredoxin family protein [Alphaproteobacteria bacterium]